MSRDVLVSARAPRPVGGKGGPGQRARGVGGPHGGRGPGAPRRGIVLAGVALVGLVAAGACVAYVPDQLRSRDDEATTVSDSLVRPQFPPAAGLTGRIMAADGGDQASRRQPVDRLQARVVISNATQRRRRILDVIVTGWGTAYVRSGARAAVAEAGGSATLAMTIIPDCGQLARADLVVLVRSTDGTDEPAVERLAMDTSTKDPYALLSDLCPRPVRGVSVTATGTALADVGVVHTRLVNNGSRAAWLVAGPVQGTSPVQGTTPGPGGAPVALVATPELPLRLAVGESVNLRLSALVVACAAAGSNARPRLVAQTGDDAHDLSPITDPDGSFGRALDALMRSETTQLCPNR